MPALTITVTIISLIALCVSFLSLGFVIVNLLRVLRIKKEMEK